MNVTKVEDTQTNPIFGGLVSIVLEIMIQSSWKIEQGNRHFLVF